MDEADVKTNRNEIEFNSFCLFLSFNFILVFFEVAEENKIWPSFCRWNIWNSKLSEKPPRDHQIICGFCGFKTEKVSFSCFVISSTLTIGTRSYKMV
jgi:hypothetical protein